MRNLKFINKSIYLPEEKSLVITDLHIGYEESMRNWGIFLPKTQYKEIIEDLKRVFKGRDIETIIILGDLKHEFGSISRQEWKETKNLIDLLKKNCDKIVLIKGNHDTILEPIAKEKDVEIKDYYIKNDLAFIHGDKKHKEILDKKIKIVFLGHMHPAITIKKEVKKETYKCFLVGEWKDKEIVILPSFFPLIEGSDVTIFDTNLDFKFDLKNFKVYIPVKGQNKVLEFGKVKDVGRLV